MRFLSAVLALVVASSAGLRAGDDSLTGNWKLVLIDDGNAVAVWLIKLESKKGKLTGTLEGLRRIPPATLDDARIEGDRIYFTINVKAREGSRAFSFEGILPKAG